jgi:hypothetical protein
MPCHRDRRMTKPVARRPLRPTGYDGMGPASTSSWRLASSPMALVTRPYRLPPRAASPPFSPVVVAKRGGRRQDKARAGRATKAYFTVR